MKAIAKAAAGVRVRHVGIAIVALGALLQGCSRSDSVPTVTGGCAYERSVGPRDVSFCGGSSWLAGVTEICDGHLVYRDYLYDDYGADAPVPTIRWNPNSSNASVVPAGDDTYPEGAENTADLVRFEMWRDGALMRVAFELNTLYTADQTIGAVAIDEDDSSTTGGGPWPGLNTASTGWEAVHLFTSADPATNTISGSFPVPVGQAWKLWAVVAQSDGTVMNVAFRGVDEQAAGTWSDVTQAAALAAGDITQFGAGICSSQLRADVTRGVPKVTGYHERVYTSQYTLPPGEGISIDGVPGPRVTPDPSDPRVYQAFNFLGRYQPYAFYVPDSPEPHGLQLTLHGFSGTHHAGAAGDASAQQVFGDALNRLLVSPLGRGLAGAYSDISERDVLDVLADAESFFAVDPSTRIVSGISMGGYGELHFGVLYPDRFAGMVGWVPPTGNFEVFPTGEPVTYYADSLPANTAQMVRNLRHVPHVQIYGALDEFVPANEADAMRTLMVAEDAGEFDFFLYLNRDHLSTYGSDQGREAQLSSNWRIPERVGRVTYRFDPSLETPAYELFHNKAYWISDLVPRDQSYADVDLRSDGCGVPVPVTADTEQTGTGPGDVQWQRTSRRITSLTPTEPAPVLEGTLANVAELSVNVNEACLSGTLAYNITTDGAAIIRFSDGRQVILPSAGQFSGAL